MAEAPVVETKNLTKRYGDFTALDDLTIHLERGHILGFIGPNGAGKTTTIKILVGLARPTSGTARICGADCSTEASKIKKHVGYMPDVFGSYDNMRAREYLDFFGAAFKIPRRERGKRIDEVMELTGATYMRDRFVESLSHGMKQRLGIARTLLHNPDVLILDEPANGLDPNARIEMRQLLLRLASLGKTLIVTSHILPELSRICDTVAIITNGKLRGFGTLDQIMRKVRQRRVVEVEIPSRDQVHTLAMILREILDRGTEVTESEDESQVRFAANIDDRKMSEVLAEVMRRGVFVSQFREVPMDLEDAFLEVTRTNNNLMPDAPQTPPSPRPPHARPHAEQRH